MADISGLSDDSEFILIGGYYGSSGRRNSSVENRERERTLRSEAWRLYSYLYDVSEKRRKEKEERLKVIINKSDLKHVSSVNMEELQDMLYSIETGVSGIKMIVFAHSKGADVAYKAMKNDALKDFLLKKKLSPDEIEERIQLIRRRTAVFTIGGVQIIPQSFAKICCNIKFGNDFAATMAHAFTEKHSEKYHEIVVCGNTISIRKSISCGSGKYLWCGSEVFLRFFSSFDRKHYLYEYIDSEVFMDAVAKVMRDESFRS